MAREGRDTKALRLLQEQRVRFVQLAADSAVVAVRGDSADYLCTYTAGRWQCPCAAYGTCSHIAAARMVYRAVAPSLAPTGRGRHDGNNR